MIKPFLMVVLLTGSAAAFAQETTTPSTSPDAPVLPAPQAESATSDLTLPSSDGTGESSVSTQQDTSENTTSTVGNAADPAVSDVQSDDASDVQTMTKSAVERARAFLEDGGPAVWAIAALSVITLALILWKIWRLAVAGAWSRGKAIQSVALFEQGNAEGALALVRGRRGIRSKVAATALDAIENLPEERAREETTRVAKRELASARVGLGALELISTIAPLLGLLGTVLGMIAAFQALQAAGSKADPALLAGGIWEALLTTAAGMAVAIPASAALTWFESVIDRIRADIEDNATRLFVAREPAALPMAAQ